MKRITIILAVIAAALSLASCEKTPRPVQPTTYTVKMEMNVSTDAAVQVDLTAFEYNEYG